MTDEEIRTIYCPNCGADFKAAVDESDEVVIVCECQSKKPWNFVDDIESQLPLPEQVDEKINKKPDSDGSRGFQ